MQIYLKILCLSEYIENKSEQISYEIEKSENGVCKTTEKRIEIKPVIGIFFGIFFGFFYRNKLKIALLMEPMSNMLRQTSPSAATPALMPKHMPKKGLTIYFIFRIFGVNHRKLFLREPFYPRQFHGILSQALCLFLPLTTN